MFRLLVGLVIEASRKGEGNPTPGAAVCFRRHRGASTAPCQKTTLQTALSLSFMTALEMIMTDRIELFKFSEIVIPQD